MRTRSFAAAAASLALVLEGLFAAPAFATTTTVTAATQPIVAWSESTTGSITLVPNYTANAVTNPSGIGSIVSATGSATYMGNAANGGLSCTASFAQSGNFINYGVVFSPITGKTSACDYQNAMLAIVTTNDTNGWTLTQQLQIAPSNGFALCAVFPQVQVVKTLPLTTSSFTGTSAAINETTCSGTGQEVLGTGSNTPGVNTLIPNPNATGTTTGTFYQGEDVLLLVTAQVVPTSYSVTMNVTLTLN